MMPILGCHMSIAGGFHQAVKRAAEAGCDCVQVITIAPRIWPKTTTKAIDASDAQTFRESLKTERIQAPLIHGSYLINLASPDQTLWLKSVTALATELLRAEALSIPYVVFHPGAFTTSNEQAGLEQITRGLDAVHAQVGQIKACCLLETTAGQGSNLGFRFEQLAQILDTVDAPERLGVCVDTCHIFAAGYPLIEREDYLKTMQDLDSVIGIDQVRAFHLNDSQQPLGSRKDRHEQIGKGCLGLEPFRHLLNDERFRGVPMYLETPKGEQADKSLDELNLATLRGLVAG